MSDKRAIGVFDSGLGGLTVVREIAKQLPNENIVYFGDTGRVPYGTRSRETIRKYAVEDENFVVLYHNCATLSNICFKYALNLRFILTYLYFYINLFLYIFCHFYNYF